MLHLAAVLSVQATVQLHEWVKTFVLVGEEGWRGKLLQWYIVSCSYKGITCQASRKTDSLLIPYGGAHLILQYSPVADPSVLVTCTVKVIDAGLLRTSTGCAGPAFSLTLYVVSLNITVIASGSYIMLC